MAPFSQAIKSSLVQRADDGTVYAGEVDPDWRIASVPHGGYVLALITNACIQSQAEQAHKDPLHVTAHYLKATSQGTYEVRIRRFRVGRGYSNITADLVQQGSVRVITHWIFGVLLPPSPSTHTTPGDLHIPPASPFYRRHPLHRPASQVPPNIPSPIDHAGHHIKRAYDREISNRNNPDTFDKDVGLQNGGWFEFVDERETLTLPSLAYFSDMNFAAPALLPIGTRPQRGSSWFPTLTLTLQFLAPVPKAEDGFAPRAIGLYQAGGFVSRPDSRHEERVEVWTAPEGFSGKGELEKDWREKQVCLCVATQMALVVSGEINQKVGSRL